MRCTSSHLKHGGYFFSILMPNYELRFKQAIVIKSLLGVVGQRELMRSKTPLS